ncbi:M23 family metallopeptidase [Polymorphobacter sp. PAMC 29334]|uniref:M23 family metallopeptidase n=1 Tax=Polymorphobacter sp. PAMC 29334 TaxID=2862331 RepID=UPI001C679FB6|nr:M23 family metallopeptidase [Polymorphobacter sp. PAMC 29334]QYE34795.1 M23 family metallopeptidase [Polymorphobacter sp. PAMC 29334]
MRRAAVLLTAGLLAGCGGRVAAPRYVPAPTPRPIAAPAVAPAPKPPWQAHRVVTDAVAVPGGRIHTVKYGETGIAIARAYGVSWSRIIATNHLKAPYTIEIGDRLLLPSAKQVAAMSVEDRAKAFKIDIDDLITGAEPAGGDPVTAKPRPRPRPATRAPVALAAAPEAPSTAPKATPKPAASRPFVPRPTPAPATAALAPLPALPTGTPVFAWPIEGRVLSSFGPKPGGRYNDGINLKASPGTAVRAAADGVVAYAGDAVAGFGNLILIKHADGWVSAYGHNETLLVARGAKVAKGDVIARSGATGAVDEPQLHFELRRGRAATDPVKLLPPRS